MLGRLGVPGAFAGIGVVVAKDEGEALVGRAIPKALEDVVGVRLVRYGKVEVRGEATLVTEDELSDGRATLEDDCLILEHVLRAQPVE